MVGDGPRMGAFVQRRLVEADGEAVHRRRRQLAHQGGGERRIHSPGQEQPHRHIRLHAQGHRGAQQLFQPVGRLLRIALEAVLHRGGAPAGRPVGRQPPPPVLHRQQGAGLQLAGQGVDGVRRRNPAQPHIQRHGVVVEAAIPGGMGGQRLQLGAEQQGSAHLGPIQRLLAEAVAPEGEAALSPVPQGEGEHAVERRHRLFHPPGRDRFQQDLGIGMAAPPNGGGGRGRGKQPGLDGGVVVDLAVEADHIAAVMGDHGLMALGAEIENGQPAEAQGDAGRVVGPDSVVVGAAMHQGRRHGADHRRPVGGGMLKIEKAGEAAHGWAMSRWKSSRKVAARSSSR